MLHACPSPPATALPTCRITDPTPGLGGTAQPGAYDWRQSWTRVDMRQYRPDSFHVGQLPETRPRQRRHDKGIDR